MATTYPKSLATDFGGNIVVDRLQQSIIADVTIITNINNITVYGDVVDIEFAATLSAPEVSQLNVLIAAHDGISAEPQIDLITTGALDSVAIITMTPTANRTITFPDATTEVVGTDTTQTMTAKTLDSPQIITTLLDINGNNMINFVPAVNAVNAITVTNAATGSVPTLSATGTDANINIDIIPKGTGVLNIEGDLITTGNLVIGGTTTTTDTTNILITDNHIQLNKNYTTVIARPGGLVVNYLPTAIVDTVAGVFTEGVAATSNPSVVTTGSATFTPGDFIQVDTADDSANDGLFEVLTHVGTLLTIRGIGIAASVETFVQNQFVDSPGATGNITQVTVSVIQVGADGLWETAGGLTSGIVFKDLITTTDSQTITGKTITAGSNTISGLTHGTEVDNPSSGVHGVIGNIVGTTDVQTLSSKIISGSTNTITLDTSNTTTGVFADARIAESSVTQHEGAIDHASITNVGTNSHSQIDTHIGDGTLHFTEASIDHASITNVGTNSHAQIDTHLSSSSGVHGVSGNVVGTSGAQTLVSKTLTAPIIATISNVGILTLPTDTDTLVARNTTDVLTNKTMIDIGSNVAAKGLHNATTIVDVSTAVAPIIGQSLVATSDTTAAWQTPTIGWKNPTRVATTQDLASEGTGYAYANIGGVSTRGQITWSSGPTAIDGVVLIDGDRILVKDNTAADSNGVWVRTSANTWDRTPDFDDDHEVISLSTMWVEEGTISSEVTYYLTTDNPIIIGGASGTNITFTSLQLNTDDIVCQARTNAGIGTSIAYIDISYAVTDVENDTSIISHDSAGLSQRITFGETGYYSVEYYMVVSTTTNGPTDVDARIQLNGATEVAGSVMSTSGDRSAGVYFWQTISKKIISLFTAGDYIIVQLQAARAGTIDAGATVIATRLRGTRGANGINGLDGAPGDIVWTGPWSGATTYTANQAVENNGASYICTTGHTNQEPPNLSFWDVIAEVGATGASGDIVWLGVWSGGTSYVLNDTIESGGSSYTCVVGNTNQIPPNVNWELVASKGDIGLTGPGGPSGDIVWLGDWSGATSYIANNAVTSVGSSYVCNTAHTNQIPPNVAFWDALANKGDVGATGPAGPNSITTIDLSAGSDVASVTTTSTAAFGAMLDVIGGMTTTPPSGTYLVSFSAGTGCVNRAQFTQTEMYVNGVGIAHTQRSNQVRVNGQKSPVHSQAQIVVTGIEVVEMRFSSTGTAGAVIYGRSMIFTKLL